MGVTNKAVKPCRILLGATIVACAVLFVWASLSFAWTLVKSVPLAEHVQPRTLLIIQGNYRTFDLTVDSIIANLVQPNMPCDVALSLDSHETELSLAVIRKLAPYLVVSYFKDESDLEAKRHYAGIEFFQTLKVLWRFNISLYTFVIRTRSDVYVAQPFTVQTTFGYGDFDGAWSAFRSEVGAMGSNSDASQWLTWWFMTAGMPFYVNLTVRRVPPVMVWSPVNAYDFNKRLLASIKVIAKEIDVSDVGALREAVQRIARTNHVTFSTGGLFVHFGLRDDILNGTKAMMDEIASKRLTWKDFDPTISYEDPNHPELAGKQRIISPEATLRLAQHAHGLAFVDLVNPADAIASFTWKFYGYPHLTRARALSSFILRTRQVRFDSSLPHLNDKYRAALEDTMMDLVNQETAAINYGCISESKDFSGCD